jgi:hypothetical protein
MEEMNRRSPLEALTLVVWKRARKLRFNTYSIQYSNTPVQALMKVVIPWRLKPLTAKPARLAGAEMSTFWMLLAWPGAVSDMTCTWVALAPRM